MAETFSGHCVLGARQRIDRRPPEADNTRLICRTAFCFYRRQVHVENPVAGGLRKAYRGTRNGMQRRQGFS